MRNSANEEARLRPYVPATEILLEDSSFLRYLPTGAVSHCSHYTFEATPRPFSRRMNSIYDIAKIVLVLLFIVMTWSLSYGEDRTPPQAVACDAVHGVVSADLSLSMGPDFHAHLFQVEGNASFAGKPLSHAKIMVRLNSSEDSQNIETTTQEDGSFSLMIALGSIPNEAVDWSIEGRDDAQRPAHLEGRQIVLADDGSINTLSQQLEFHRNTSI